MFPIRELLFHHEKFANRTTLPGNLGDGFLYAQNPVYRRARDLSAAFGYTYSNVDFCNYVAMPLGALPEILKQKRIPYVENASALQRLENERPDTFHIQELSRLKTNVILHESCHAVAESLMPNGTTHSAFAVFFSEGFALGCEAAGNLFIDSEPHRRFYELNCYGDCFLEESVSHKLREASVALGLDCTLQLTHLSYLSALFCGDPFDRRRAIRVLELLSKNSESELSVQLAQSVLNVGKRLNVGFVLKTSAFYMKLIGLDQDFETIQGVDFLDIIESEPIYRDALLELGKVMGEDRNAQISREYPSCILSS
jgi:hypothetical protein